MLITCKKKAEIEVLKKLHNIAFNMKNLGNVKKKLGVEIIRSRSRDQFSYHKRSTRKGF